MPPLPENSQDTDSEKEFYNKDDIFLLLLFNAEKHNIENKAILKIHIESDVDVNETDS